MSKRDEIRAEAEERFDFLYDSMIGVIQKNGPSTPRVNAALAIARAKAELYGAFEREQEDTLANLPPRVVQIFNLLQPDEVQTLALTGRLPARLTAYAEGELELPLLPDSGVADSE